MTRIARSDYLHDGSYFHVTWQCHNHRFYFRDDKFKLFYYHLLKRFKQKYNIKIFSYCIMSNHVHLVGQCKFASELSDYMRIINSLFAKFFNKQNGRRGQVCMDRFKSPIIHTDQDLLKVMQYVELNPVRANMVTGPKYYKFSSYQYYAKGRADSLITNSPAFLELGETDKERRREYIKLVDEIVVAESNRQNGLQYKREKINFNHQYYIGDPDWIAEMYKALHKNKVEKRLVSRVLDYEVINTS